MVVEWDTTIAPSISSQEATPEHAGKEQPCAQMVPESPVLSASWSSMSGSKGTFLDRHGKKGTVHGAVLS